MVKKSIDFLEKQKLEILAEEWETKKSKTEMMLFEEIWFEKTGISIIKIIKDFIMEKGLKIYGGLALHEHLKKYKEPLYNRHDFPDYDVFSPNAWEHAKELCDKLYKMGHNLVETRGSTLNDAHHQTYKVSVDSFYIIDITQTGCSIEQLNANDCETCGETIDKKCISIFNHIPVYDITYNIKSTPKIYKETYNYDTNKSIFPKKLFICDPEWLRISMYRELTEPLSNPLRLPKVGARLTKFNKYFPHYVEDCSLDEYKNIVNKDYKNILNFIGKFIKTNQLINYGASSYNLFVQNNKQDVGSLEISDYEVYIDRNEKYLHEGTVIIEKLLNLLKKKYNNFVFKKEAKKLYWKEVDVDNVYIYGKKKGSSKYNKLITFTYISECMPYIQYNGERFVTIDRLKHLYYRAIALPEVIQLTVENPLNYKCLLDNLLKIEQSHLKKNPNSKRSKFRRYVLKCHGSLPSKMWDIRMRRTKEKIEQAKVNKFILDHPKQGFITKMYKTDKDVKLPYMPAEQKNKQYYIVDNNKLKKVKKKTKKLIKRFKHSNIL
jgi:hypothetical protein